MFALWDSSVAFSIENVKRPDGLRHVTIHDTLKEDGACIFLHGVAIEKYKGTFFSDWGNNWGIENSVTEVLRGKRSKDALVWTDPEQISPKDVPFAVSHGVYMASGGQLRTLAAHFYGGSALENFGGLRCDSFLLDEQCKNWISEGTVIDNFWPLTRPLRMGNGNYIMGGCDAHWRGAIAVSEGSNPLQWRNFSLDVDGKVYTEATCWVFEKQVVVIMRNETDLTNGIYNAAVAVSEDWGETFSPCCITNLPMANSKPFGGHLSDGRSYLVYNYPLRGKNDRSCLLLALTRPNERKLSAVYELDRWDGGLAYPYAIEEDGQLYVTYSARCSSAAQGLNLNDARLAIVPLSAT